MKSSWADSAPINYRVSPQNGDALKILNVIGVQQIAQIIKIYTNVIRDSVLG